MGLPFMAPLSWQERSGLHTAHLSIIRCGLPEEGQDLGMMSLLAKEIPNMLIVKGFLPAALPAAEVINPLILKDNTSSR